MQKKPKKNNRKVRKCLNNVSNKAVLKYVAKFLNVKHIISPLQFPPKKICIKKYVWKNYNSKTEVQ